MLFGRSCHWEFLAGFPGSQNVREPCSAASILADTALIAPLPLPFLALAQRRPQSTFRNPCPLQQLRPHAPLHTRSSSLQFLPARCDSHAPSLAGLHGPDIQELRHYSTAPDLLCGTCDLLRFC